MTRGLRLPTTWHALFFVAPLAWTTFTGCSTTLLMTYSMKETMRDPAASPYGAPIKVRYQWKDTIIYVDPKGTSTISIRQRKRTFYGELIACDTHTRQIYVYTIEGEWLVLSADQVRRLRLYLYDRRVPSFFSWRAPFILVPFTILHLFLAAMEVPSYLGWGVITVLMDKAIRQEAYHRFQRIRLHPEVYPSHRLKLVQSILPYARFPGGLPPGWKKRFRSP